jgi:Protein of unknown function (DUF2934)
MESVVARRKEMPKSKAAAPQAAKKPAKKQTAPTYDAIALRAYHIYLERGCMPGDPMQDWLQAERELSNPPSKTRRKTKVVPIAA